MRQATALTILSITCAFPLPAAADELARWGTVATLAPLCGLRDEAWAFDLRRAELHAATGSRGVDDEALQTAPGGQQVTAALSAAEMEALESFAEGAAEQTCGPLRSSPDLREGDDRVRAFRELRVAPGS